jgi:transcriptional regulator with XRE-family HTH domain
MSFKGHEIRKLRQRLGWSLAEMARQMGCSTELVSQWELNAANPDADSLNQLRYLSVYVETYSDQISQQPFAEQEMEDRRVSQLTYRELLNGSGRN